MSIEDFLDVLSGSLGRIEGGCDGGVGGDARNIRSNSRDRMRGRVGVGVGVRGGMRVRVRLRARMRVGSWKGLLESLQVLIDDLRLSVRLALFSNLWTVTAHERGSARAINLVQELCISITFALED